MHMHQSRLVNVVKVNPKAEIPEYATEGSSGFDLKACIDEPIRLGLGEWKLIPTGLKMSVPRGFEIQIRPRSGLALKQGITVKNTPGTIDSDYRGEIGVILYNEGNATFVVNNGDRIAQGVLCPIIWANFVETDDLIDTERGQGGFGSTGK